jgi:hypothetical protein
MHHRKNHPSSSQRVDRNESMIYDPISLLKGRAVEVRKLEPWEGNFWGRKKRKAAREVDGPDDGRDFVPNAGYDNGYMSGVNQ